MIKVSPISIILDHFATLVDARSGRTNIWDILIFYGFPLLLGGCVLYFRFGLPELFTGAVLNAVSIFSALLFASQIAVFGIYQQSLGDLAELEQDPANRDNVFHSVLYERQKDRVLLMREVGVNISYSILICVISLIVILISLVSVPYKTYFDAGIISLVSHLGFTLLMLLRRLHFIFAQNPREEQ